MLNHPDGYTATKKIAEEKQGFKTIGIVVEAEKWGTFEKIWVVLPVSLVESIQSDAGVS